MRTTNAFGTSWTSRHGSPQTVNVARDGVRRLRVGLDAAASASVKRPGLRRRDLDLLAEHGAVAPAAAAIIWFIASATAESSSSVELGRRRVLGLLHAHHRGGERCARRRASMTKTLPPVTPST